MRGDLLVEGAGKGDEGEGDRGGGESGGGGGWRGGGGGCCVRLTAVKTLHSFPVNVLQDLNPPLPLMHLLLHSCSGFQRSGLRLTEEIGSARRGRDGEGVHYSPGVSSVEQCETV